MSSPGAAAVERLLPLGPGDTVTAEPARLGEVTATFV